MDAHQIIAKLVSFPTVSSESNLDLMHWIRDYLDQYDVQSHILPSEDGIKANLYATIGPSVAGGIVLSGHTDVVPVTGQSWKSDPFQTVTRGGRMYGRGTCDMKGFVGIALAAVPAMVAKGLKRPIHLAFTHDEEIGCVGAPFLISELVAKLPPVDAVIVGEPTNMKIIENHKGLIAGYLEVKGRNAHSSMPQLGVDANLAAHRWMSEAIALTDDLGARSHPDRGFEPACSTINFGVISGGHAFNIISADCRIDWSVRVVPGDRPEDIIATLQAAADNIDRQLKCEDAACGAVLRVETQVPPFQSEAHPVAADLCRRLTGDNGRDRVVSFATEAGQFQQAGYSVVVCGPGSIEQAHKPDEYIELSQIAAGEALLHSIIDSLAQ